MSDEEPQEFEPMEVESGVVEEEVEEGGGGGGGPPGIGDKIVGSCAGCCFGAVLFPLALIMLAMNEKSYITKEYAYMQAETMTKTLDCNADLTGMAGKAIFFSCPIDPALLKANPWKPSNFETTNPVIDNIAFIGVTAKQVINVAQCIETEHKTTRKQGKKTITEYSYSYRVDYAGGVGRTSPSEFNRNGPAIEARKRACETNQPAGLIPRCPSGIAACAASSKQYSSNVQAGVFKITRRNVQDLEGAFGGDMIQVPLGSFSEIISTPTSKLYDGSAKALPEFMKGKELNKTDIGLDGNTIVTCNPSTGIKIGCVQIEYYASSLAYVTFAGALSAERGTAPLTIPGSILRSGSDFSSIQSLQMTKADLFKQLRSSNTQSLYIIRIVGVIFAWFASYLLLQPVAAAVDVATDVVDKLPLFCLAPFVHAVNGFIDGAATAIVCLISCCCGFSCGLFTIALFWVVARPEIGVPLMIVVCCIFGVGGYFIHQHKAQKDAENAGGDAEAGEEGNDGDE